MIVDGVMVNRMIFRAVVNVPSEQVYDAMVGAITRAYRDIFGMARPTPRAVVYGILGVEAPDKRLWVTVITELIKALNSPNYLRLDVVGCHRRLTPQVDKDITRVRHRLKEMQLTLQTLTRQRHRRRCVIVSPKLDVCRLYVVGDASYWTTWGTVMVINHKGRFLLWR